MVSFSRQRQSHLAMLGFSALVAGSFAFGVRIAHEITPGALNAVRFGIAAGLLMFLASNHGLIPLVKGGRLWRFPVLGVCLAIYFVLMFEGLKRADAVSTSAVFTLTPILSGVFGYFLLRQRLTVWTMVALTLGGIGALWVIFRGDLLRFLTLDIGPGEAIFFVGVVFHALYTPLVRKLNRGEAALPFAAATTFAAFLIIALYSLQDLAATEFSTLRPQIWLTILYLAIFASATTFFLLQFAALHLNSANVMAYTYLVPIWVICWEFALGGSLPSAAVIGGVVLTVGAMVMLLRA